MAADYSELLRHPFWQRKRLEIFQRDDFTCKKCLATESNLQVHHIYYLTNHKPWEYPNEALITLCELCHAKAEFAKWLLTKGQTALLRLGLIYEDRMEVIDMFNRKAKDNFYKQDVLRFIEDTKKFILKDG